jgi:hypothetical protein
MLLKRQDPRVKMYTYFSFPLLNILQYFDFDFFDIYICRLNHDRETTFSLNCDLLPKVNT